MPSPVDVRQYHGCSKTKDEDPPRHDRDERREVDHVRRTEQADGAREARAGNSGLNDCSVGSDGERSPDAPLARTPNRGRQAAFLRGETRSRSRVPTPSLAVP